MEDEMSQQALVSQNNQNLITQIIDEIFETNEESRLHLIEHYLKQLDTDSQASSNPEIRMALIAMGDFQMGLSNIQAGNFVQAKQSMQSASIASNQLGIIDFGNIADALMSYTDAIINLQQLNIAKATELFSGAKTKLQHASKYGKKFESLIDHMEPEALFVAMMQALMQEDLQQAKALSKLVFKASEYVADHYYNDGDPEFYRFKGLANLYSSFYLFYQSIYDINHFKYIDLVSQPNLANVAMLARELLERTNSNSVLIKNNIAMSKSIAVSMNLLVELAKYMDLIFKTVSREEVYDELMLNRLKKQAQDAVDYASEIGPQAVPFIRVLDGLGQQVKNLDLLLKRLPNIKATQAAFNKKLLHPSQTKIFIVHGHANDIKEAVARFLEHLDLEVTILQEQPNQGRNILEKLIDYAKESTFAIVLMTADDRGGTVETTYENQRKRARQNVIFELGYFLAVLEKGHVCAIYEEGVETPSDYQGVLYTPLDNRNSWKLSLARELRSAGIDIDLNKAI